AREQVVVVAVEQQPAAYVKRRGLAAKAGPALVNIHGDAASREVACSGQTCDPCTQHRDALSHLFCRLATTAIRSRKSGQTSRSATPAARAAATAPDARRREYPSRRAK